MCEGSCTPPKFGFCVQSTPKKLYDKKNSFSSSGKIKDDGDDLIEVVNKLQNTLAATGHTLSISLPQIVVVGCQSAGKSSVL
ncbi:Dynamin-1, partial [Stegodyphus mimosarum]